MNADTDLRITQAALDDAPLVYRIMQDAFAEYHGVLTPPPGVYTETVEDVINAMKAGGAVIAWVGDDAAGSARYAFLDNGHCYVGRVSVLPAYRGHGVASAMMLYIEPIARDHKCKAMEVTVRAVLENNIHLYQHIGYAVTETYEHPKGGGMIATMVKPL